MSVLFTTTDALAPIAFVAMLGILAGRAGILKSESGSVLANLALGFCLPALLFGTISVMSITELVQWKFLLGITLGFIIIYGVATAGALLVFRKSMADSSLQALNSAYPNVGFLGIPVLTSIAGTSALLPIAIGNLVSSIVLVPMTIAMLEVGAAVQTKRKMRSVIGSSILKAVQKPVVWSPVLGVLMVVLHIPLPNVAHKSLLLIGNATSGVSLFAMGLLLSGQKFRVDIASLANVVFKNIAQPAVMFGMALTLGVVGVERKELILIGALPTALITAMLSMQYKVYVNDSNATVVISTVFSIISLGVIVAMLK